jgi:ferredoxin
MHVHFTFPASGRLKSLFSIAGACGGELACSTCHLVFDKEVFDTLPKMQEDELDMLDLAFEVTETSRLGCQILVREDMAGMRVRIPDDGF